MQGWGHLTLKCACALPLALGFFLSLDTLLSSCRPFLPFAMM
jgi:hypothetical protein